MSIKKLLARKCGFASIDEVEAAYKMGQLVGWHKYMESIGEKSSEYFPSFDVKKFQEKYAFRFSAESLVPGVVNEEYEKACSYLEEFESPIPPGYSMWIDDLTSDEIEGFIIALGSYNFGMDPIEIACGDLPVDSFELRWGGGDDERFLQFSRNKHAYHDLMTRAYRAICYEMYRRRTYAYSLSLSAHKWWNGLDESDREGIYGEDTDFNREIDKKILEFRAKIRTHYDDFFLSVRDDGKGYDFSMYDDSAYGASLTAQSLCGGRTVRLFVSNMIERANKSGADSEIRYLKSYNPVLFDFDLPKASAMRLRQKLDEGSVRIRAPNTY